MATGNSLQYSQVREVIREAHKPDTTFHVAAEVKARTNVAPLPVEVILVDIRSTLRDVEDTEAKGWFLAHYTLGVSWRALAVIAGRLSASGDYIKNRCDSMLDDGISRMPRRLFNKCLDIYDRHLRGGFE